MNEIVMGLIGGLGLLILVVAGLALMLYLVPIPLWIAAWASGAYVGLLTLIGMRLRRVPPTTVVTARISAVKAGLDISINDLEAHFLAGGNVVRVVNAMISADKANIPLPFKRAAAIDLAGRNVLEAVQMSVLPKVIETPQDRRRGQGRHPADRRLPRDGAHQHRPAGRRRRRGDDHRARRRGHGQHHRLGRSATRTCSRTRTTSPSTC